MSTLGRPSVIHSLIRIHLPGFAFLLAVSWDQSHLEGEWGKGKELYVGVVGGGLGEAGLTAQSDDREKGLQKTEQEAKRLMRLANKAYFTILFKADTAGFQYEGSELTFRCRWFINKLIINSQEEIWPCVLFFVWESFPFCSLHPPLTSLPLSLSLCPSFSPTSFSLFPSPSLPPSPNLHTA